VRDSPLLSGLFRWLLNSIGRIMVLVSEFKAFLEDLGVKSDKIILLFLWLDRSMPEVGGACKRRKR
jgi:hypothetical protein